MDEGILEKIHKSALKLLSPLNPEKTFETIVNEAIRLVEADYGSLMLEKDGEFTEVYSTLPIRIKRRKKGLTYKSFKDSKVILFHPKDSKSFLKAHPEFASLPIESNLNIPLSYKKKSMGVLIVNSKARRAFSKKELDIMLLFGSFASLAIRKAQLYQEATKALEVRDMFISMAAHELRTPLTAINGYSQLLNSRLKNEDTPEARWSKSLVFECTRLTLLVNELLETNRIKSGQLNYSWKECDLNEVLDRAISTFNFKSPSHKLIYHNKLNGQQKTVIADFDKLLQVFDNVLDNAAKFSPQESEIHLNITSKKRLVCITVEDHGSGIPKIDLPQIFDQFYRGSNHQIEGIGIGLFLVKNIIKMHHGTIDIKTKEKKGTRVEISLPIFKTK